MALQEKLHELFLLDCQVRGMRSRLDNADRRHGAVQRKLDQLSQQHSELANQIKAGQVKANSFEHEANDCETRIDHLRQQMNQVRSNREYSALLLEVNTLKVKQGDLEEQALEELTRIDELRAQLKELVDQAKTQQKIVDAAAAEVKAHQAEVGQELETLTVKRSQAEQQVPQHARDLFNRLSEEHDGEAMTPVFEQNRKALEYNCGGCFMSIPIEHVNALIRRPDQLTCCPSCARILYMDSDLKATMGLKA